MVTFAEIRRVVMQLKERVQYHSQRLDHHVDRIVEVEKRVQALEDASIVAAVKAAYSRMPAPAGYVRTWEGKPITPAFNFGDRVRYDSPYNGKPAFGMVIPRPATSKEAPSRFLWVIQRNGKVFAIHYAHLTKVSR